MRVVFLLRGDSDAGAVMAPADEPLATDSPFAETKEAVGGFYIVDCGARSETIELAGRVPKSPGVTVEGARNRRAVT